MQSEGLVHQQTIFTNALTGHIDPAQRDPDVLRRIEANFLGLCKCGLSVNRSLMLDNDNDFEACFEQYKTALRRHLRVISVDLYVFLRNALPDGAERDLVNQLETESDALNHRIIDFLSSIESTKRLHPKLTVKAMSSISRALEDHFMRENAMLFPIYRGIA